MNEVFNVALYMRLSRDDGDKDESFSISNQRELLISYLKDKDNFYIYDEYIDDGYSGTNLLRPAFKRMINDIKNRQINCIIVKDLSRFGRDYIDVGYYLEKYFIEKNIRFISINDCIDSFKKEYDMLLPVKNVVNAEYAKDISKKVQSSFKIKQKSGKFIGAFASYGYIKSSGDKHKLVIDEYAADIVRRIFKLFIAGNGKMKIAAILNNEDIPCPSMYKKLCGQNYANSNRLAQTTYWTYSTVHKMLSNEMYIGNMVQGKTVRRMKGKPKLLEESKWIKVRNTHPAIIDQYTWLKVQNLLKKDTRQINLNQNLSIFAGFLRCGDCERAMAKQRGYRKKEDIEDKVVYRCGSYTRYGKKYCSSHRIDQHVLEEIILNDLKCIISSIKDLKSLIEGTEKVLPGKTDALQKEIEKDSRELQKTERLKRSIYEDYKESVLTKDEYLRYKKEYIDKETLLQQKIDSLTNRLKEYPKQNIFNHDWIQNLFQLKTVKILDREIIVDMIDTIYIYEGNRIKIIYNFSGELEALFNKNYECRNN